MKVPTLFRVSILAAFLMAPLAAQDPSEFLPTPYSAEELRDAWVEGFEVTTRTRSAAGETYSRARVVVWSEEAFTMMEVEVDPQGQPIDGVQLRQYSGTWEELRDHARFPVSRAGRERAQWETSLGELEGWLYKVRGEEGITEFFFADGLPGPPVIYRRQGEGLDGFVAEQVTREVRAVGDE